MVCYIYFFTKLITIRLNFSDVSSRWIDYTRKNKKFIGGMKLILVWFYRMKTEISNVIHYANWFIIFENDNFMFKF